MKNPNDFVLVRRGVLLGAAIILEQACRRLFASGTTEVWQLMKDAAEGDAVQPPAKPKRDWLK